MLKLGQTELGSASRARSDCEGNKEGSQVTYGSEQEAGFCSVWDESPQHFHSGPAKPESHL